MDDILLKDAYELFLDDRCTSCVQETIVYYKENLISFFAYCEESLGKPYPSILCREITRDLFAGYIRQLRDRPKLRRGQEFPVPGETLSATSVRTYARAIRSFCSFCYDNGYCDNFTRKVKLPRPDPRKVIPLYQSEAEALDRCFDLSREQGLRNWCIVHLMLDAGLRSSEVSKLRIRDLLFDKNILTVANGKGNKTRLVLLCRPLAEKLQDYIHTYRKGASRSSCVLLSLRTGEPITTNTIKQLLFKLKSESGVPRIYPHLLRHTFATSYICGGGNIEMLRLLLGHYDYSVTQMYLHLAHQSSLLHSDIYRLDPIFFQNY